MQQACCSSFRSRTAGSHAASRRSPSLRTRFAAFSALWATLGALLVQPPYEFGPAAIGAFGLVSLLGIVASPRIGALVDRLGARALVFGGAAALATGFALLAAGASGIGWLIAGMVLLDFGNRAGLVANQSRASRHFAPKHAAASTQCSSARTFWAAPRVPHSAVRARTTVAGTAWPSWDITSVAPARLESPPDSGPHSQG